MPNFFTSSAIRGFNLTPATQRLQMELTRKEREKEDLGEIEPFEVPTFIPPKADVGRTRTLTQRGQAPEVRRLRQGLTQAIQKAQQSDNPAVAGFLTRRALQGFGQGLEQVTRGAAATAQQTTDREFAAEVRGKELEFGGEITKARLEHEERLRERELERLELEGDITGLRQGLFAPQTHTVGRIPSARVPSDFGGGARTGGRETFFGKFRRTTSPEPTPNPQFWPGGFQQQSEATRLSEAHNIPLEDFFGDVNPESVIDRDITG